MWIYVRLRYFFKCESTSAYPVVSVIWNQSKLWIYLVIHEFINMKGIQNKSQSFRKFNKTSIEYYWNKRKNLVLGLLQKTCAACVLCIIQNYSKFRKLRSSRSEIVLHDTILRTDALFKISGSWKAWLPRKTWPSFLYYAYIKIIQSSRKQEVDKWQIGNCLIRYSSS